MKYAINAQFVPIYELLICHEGRDTCIQYGGIRRYRPICVSKSIEKIRFKNKNHNSQYAVDTSWYASPDTLAQLHFFSEPTNIWPVGSQHVSSTPLVS